MLGIVLNKAVSKRIINQEIEILLSSLRDDDCLLRFNAYVLMTFNSIYIIICRLTKMKESVVLVVLETEN